MGGIDVEECNDLDGGKVVHGVGERVVEAYPVFGGT